ncbi:MAG: cytochrome P450 [Chloroflexaceae bacterium]|nr:cytochrome P450 [Chloroflexaceae bacterium]
MTRRISSTPGPSRSLPGATLLAFQRDPIGFVSALAAEYGDIVRFRLGSQPTLLLSNPDHIRDVLVTSSKNFAKGRALQRAGRLLGEGLLTSEGEFHRRQRRLVAPAFHRQRIAAYGERMACLAEAHQARWRPGQTVDMAAEMMRLTLRIAGDTLFGADTDATAAEVAAAMHDLLELFVLVPLPFSETLERLPLPSVRRFHAARERLDRIIYDLIARRRACGEDRGDLLSMLLAARDVEGDGSGMSDRQVRDEALTIFLAGHETTANALAWTFYLLSQHPEVAARLRAELDAALGGRAPTVADLPRLGYAEMVFAEALRLYPPAWIIGRRALQPFSLGGEEFAAGTIVLMSQWVVHHDPRHYPDPYRFDPERFRPEARAARHRFAYFPFGGGPRICIGESFAWMEGTLVLATLARRWQPALLPGHPVALQPTITLRPRHGLRMRLDARS